jgi:hypothetical protein
VGLKTFRPVCYLTDEVGVPDQQPCSASRSTGGSKLRSLEKAVDALESERQIMMYMRHEAGHVFNYAYRLYTTPQWRELFGSFFRPYRDEYPSGAVQQEVRAAHRGLVRAEASDEDFAETFAVWLTPRSPWRRQYKGWPADEEAPLRRSHGQDAGDVEPIVKTGEGGHHARTTSV